MASIISSANRNAYCPEEAGHGQRRHLVRRQKGDWSGLWPILARGIGPGGFFCGWQLFGWGQLQLLGDDAGEVSAQNARAGFGHDPLYLLLPFIIDDGHQGRSAGQEALANYLEILVRDARIDDFSSDRANQSAGRPSDNGAARPAEKADYGPNEAASQGAAPAAGIGGFRDLQLTAAVALDDGRSLNGHGARFLGLLELVEGYAGRVDIIKDGQQ